MLGARRLTRLMMPLPFTSCISDNCAFVRFDVCRRRWLLPPFVRTTLPEPVRRKRLEVALWVFSLFFPAFALRGIADFSFQTKLNRGTKNMRPRTLTIFGTCLATNRLSLPAQPEPARLSLSFLRCLWRAPAPRAWCGPPFAVPLPPHLHLKARQRSLSNL